ncbi:DNA-binding protein [Brucella sp. H1_1004]|uniref:helix-turn-helix transcriptional regulator n=1 Tax=Brucella sp. H1_1004 TaxID=3110109 RepID=UPI0039B39CCC
MHLSDLSTRYVRTDEAALFLGLSPWTLEKHHTFGTGPVYRKLGARVVYALEDLTAWADLGTTTSTSDSNSQMVRPAARRAAEFRRKA